MLVIHYYDTLGVEGFGTFAIFEAEHIVVHPVYF